jgi:hypothetical protein
MPGSYLKNWYRTRNPLLRAVAEALNTAATWMNTFDGQTPIVVAPVQGGVLVTWEPIESPYPHPWRVTRTDDGKLDVAGGLVYRVTAEPLVAAPAAGITAADGLRIYLNVLYSNGATTDAATIGSTTGAWPEDDYAADEIDAASLPDSGWSRHYIRLAEIDGTDLLQYQYGDVCLPKGATYRIAYAIGSRWAGPGTTEYELLVAMQTWVNGVLQPLAAAPQWVTQFSTGPCPTPP